jgi:ABC-2 type transport system ATP-binding protein
MDLNVADDILRRQRAVEQALRVEHVSKYFGGPSRLTRPGGKPKKRVTAVDDISLEVRRGEIYGVLGANGSGKSTLIRLIATLLFPDAGHIEVFGLDVVREAGQVRRLLNRVSVEASLFKKLSAMENLLYAARLYSVETSSARQEIVRIMGALGIPEARVRQPVEKMSRGMQQKVAIARALLTAPVVLLLDEPTTGLDPRSKKDVQRFVLELRETHDATVLLTSHDMDEADALCDRLAILHKGRIVVEGTPLELKEAHANQGGSSGPLPSLEDVFMEVTGRSLADDEEGDDEE